MPEVDYAELLNVLASEAETLRSLNAALATQTTTLMQGEPQRLLAALSATGAQARRLEQLEGRRTALLAAAPSGTTATELVATAPEPFRSRCQALQGECRELVAAIGASNATHARLAAAGLNFTRRYQASLRAGLADPPAYPPGGRPQPRAASRLLDLHA